MNPKNKNRFDFDGLLMLVALFGLFAALALPASAQLSTNTAATGVYQTGQPNFATVDTNYTAYVVTNGQTLSYTAGGTNTLKKTIRQNQGLTLMLAVWSTNGLPTSSSTNYTVKFDLTADGSTWTKGNGAYPLTWTVPLVGNTTPFTNVFWTNIQSTFLSNVRQIQATQVGTTAATNVSAALLYSQSTQ